MTVVLWPSPDRHEKPCKKKGLFFLFRKSDQRKLLSKLRKMSFIEQACNIGQEIAS
jgi:hypothetical protein